MSTSTESVRALTTAEFDAVVGEETTTLVDFWAPWCGPCQQQLPLLSQFAANAPEGVTVAKVNIDEEPTVAQKLGIRSIPTMIVFRNGQEVRRHTGVATPPQLAKLVE